MTEPVDPGEARAGDWLLGCGIAAALIYVASDVVAASAYPGYSFTDQAVSELFAIGAPTSGAVVAMFSASSTLLLLFALGIGRASGGSRSLRLLALMFGGSALVALALWNFFPMHMRGDQRGFTDRMHLILSTNPFVLATMIVSLFAFRGRFRVWTIGTLSLILVLALYGFRLAPALELGQPTPGLGLSERLAQYAYEAWQVGLALLLTHRLEASAPRG